MLLAWMRFILICCRNSWIYDRVSDTISKGSFFAIVAAIFVPALIWTSIVYFGSPATGIFWVFRPAHSSSYSELITVFQSIPDSERHQGKPIVIVMALLILLQLFLTIFFYIRICYDSFMSTLNVNLKRDRNHEERKENDFSVKKEENTEMENVQQNYSNSQGTKIFHISGKQSSGNRNEEEPSKRRIPHILSKDHKPASPNLLHPKLNNDNADAITEWPDGHITSNTVTEESSNSISAVSSTDSMNINSEKESKQAMPKVKDKQKKDRKHKNKFFLPTANDYKNFGPVSGAYKINIPLTKVVLCVSQRDIVCTASLTCQIICLILTHVLMVYSFTTSGKKISLSRYESSTICIEIALIINGLVDSLVSLLFSSNFREAAFKIVFPPKKNQLKSSFKSTYKR